MTRARARRRAAPPAPERGVDYHNLRRPFPPAPAFSDDHVAAIHALALRALEELGVKVLLPEARAMLARAGARVDGDMAFIGRDIVEAALATAPPSFTLRAGAPQRDLRMAPDALIIMSGAGAPHATDLKRGRRPGSLRDYEELVKLTQSFDVLHMLNPVVEPQDSPIHLRHYDFMRIQLTLSDKVPFLYARGARQVAEGLEMLQAFRGATDEEFAAAPHCYTIINTNSPRQIDIPMAQGLIDFARAGQLSVVTPFCLMGAMAPVTVSGALALSHAEALAAITLTQIARPGAPVLYGAFASNVDMKSGAPAFGTPEHVRANLGAGQLARLIGLPWRCAAGSAANVSDAQAANETQMSAWGAVLAGCNMLVHAAGWLEGGLTVSYEKLITDLEVMQTFAELCAPPSEDAGELAWEALSEVSPGGHFFGCAHTMARYQTAFYDPLVADWSNFGTWTERGAVDATARATAIWERRLAEFEPPQTDPARVAALQAYIERGTEAGGAPPES